MTVSWVHVSALRSRSKLNVNKPELADMVLGDGGIEEVEGTDGSRRRANVTECQDVRVRGKETPQSLSQSRTP